MPSPHAHLRGPGPNAEPAEREPGEAWGGFPGAQSGRRWLGQAPRHLLFHSCPRLAALQDSKSLLKNKAFARPGFCLQAPSTSVK